MLQPDEVGTGFVALPAQTGPADVARIAGFSANAPAAQASLRRHHFEAGYVVEYLDSASGRFIVNVVTRFADDRGATADLTADLARQGSGAEHVDVASLGDQSGATRQPYKDGGPTGQLLTLRFRVGATTMLLSLGGRKPVDVADAQGIATHLVDRLRAASGATAPTDSPAPGATSS